MCCWNLLIIYDCVTDETQRNIMSYNTTSTEIEGRTNECIKEEEEEEESAMSARQHQQPSFLIMTFSFDISEQQTQN